MAAGKFFKGMVYGALIGGALTLLDQQTRKEILIKGKEVGQNVKGIVTNPREKLKRVQEKILFFRETIQDMNDDLQFIMKQAAEIKELGEDTVKIIEETKEVFQKEKTESENQRH